MNKSVTKNKTTAKEVVEETPPNEESSVLEDAEQLLEEIDSLLEEQAVLLNFRQRGGE